MAGFIQKSFQCLTNALARLKLSVLQPTRSTIIRWMGGDLLRVLMTPEGAFGALRFI